MIRFPFSLPRGVGHEDQADETSDDKSGGDALTDASNAAHSYAETPDDAGGASDHPRDAASAVSAAEGPLGTEVGASTGGAVATPMEEQVRMVEAMLFASDKPLSTAELASRMPIGCDAAVAVRRLEDAYRGRGVELARVAGKWAFRTASDLSWLLSGEAVESRKLSRAAIETLAIIAYHQPVTRAEIEEIRRVGVSKGTVDLLMELEWVKLGRRRQTPGRPVTFVTTERFLEHFGFESLRDLPRLQELREAGLLESRPPIGFKMDGVGEDADLDDEALDDDEIDGDGRRDADDLLI